MRQLEMKRPVSRIPRHGDTRRVPSYEEFQAVASQVSHRWQPRPWPPGTALAHRDLFATEESSHLFFRQGVSPGRGRQGSARAAPGGVVPDPMMDPCWGNHTPFKAHHLWTHQYWDGGVPKLSTDFVWNMDGLGGLNALNPLPLDAIELPEAWLCKAQKGLD